MDTPNPPLSVLVLDGDRNKALARELWAQAEAFDGKVQVICAYGGKFSSQRKDLLQAAEGRYIVFVKDGALVDDGYVESLMARIFCPDVLLPADTAPVPPRVRDIVASDGSHRFVPGDWNHV
jgi:hypothetical protein